ncbi:MAG: 4-alpha-glucanotransferase [Chitinispirillaceae bacterium]|nr:4-alpha-glucanotransferase [Chitinispirillaceae bacterium]
MKRSAGIFLHPTSLPSRFGIGDLGESVYKWIDILAESRHVFWQVCPLGPTGFGDSPYQSLCSLAGNTLLISPEKLFEQELLTTEELVAFPHLSSGSVEYGTVIVEKKKLFEKAYARFNDSAQFSRFCEDERYWLDDFALFMVIKKNHGTIPWIDWEPSYKLRFPAALDELDAAERREVRYHKFLQYMFHVQWNGLHDYARQKGVRIIGDLPYYVAFDSSDTWGSPELFELDEKGNPLRVAGVPPDYFSKTGQLWGNPLYQWNNMRQDGFAWWVRRIKKMVQQYDYLRLDHFRGFESYWAIPAGSATAVDGTWERGPGEDFFSTVRFALGDVPLIAEDLGETTHGVEELRRKAGIPGMKVLQFAFTGDPENPYLPCNVCRDSIMYTGTHDNDTSCGWFEGLAAPEQDRVAGYLGCTRDDFLDRFLRLAYMSPSMLCIVPVQDALGLGSGNRMNVPGRESGNWCWRMAPEHLSATYFSRVKKLARIYGRDPGEAQPL